MNYQITVVGGGPAGMMAAIAAAQEGASVTLLEKNGALGEKLLLTGKGRCNVTTSRSKREIVAAFSETGNGRFLWDSLNQFGNQDLRQFFEDRGLKLKEERGHRLFPVTDSARSVLDVLQKELTSLGVDIHRRAAVHKVTKHGDLFTLHVSSGNLTTPRLILATGGKSYPQTGSSGDGFSFARKLGHQTTALRGVLVPLESPERKIRKLQGLALKNVALSLWSGDKLITQQFGELLFTHFGISGPIVLEAGRFLGPDLSGDLVAQIDFKPALSVEQLDARLLRESTESPHINYHTLLTRLLPKKIIPLAIRETEVVAAKKISQLEREERQSLINFLKGFQFAISGPQPIEKAIITAGGVDLAEIEPKTLQSRICSGLYFAGELLDLDGPTGGFNLQMCFTTGYVAGRAAAQG